MKMKNIALALLMVLLPAAALADNHGKKEHGGKAAESKEHGGKAAESKEHGGKAAASKDD